jgi:hypothetical protein
MQQQTCNGNSVVVNSRSRYVIINERTYPFLPNMKGRSSTTINGSVFIDGYELKNGKWKRTIRSLWHLLF